MSDPRPRVLLVSAEFAPTPGGVGDYTARLAEALTQGGTETAVLTGQPATSQPGRPPLTLTTTAFPTLRLVPDWDWRAWPSIERAAATWRASIVHLQYQTGAYRMHPAINLLPRWLGRPAWWPLPARRAGRPPALVTTFHDIRQPYLFPRAGRLRQVVTEQLARGSQLVIATNPADYATLHGLSQRTIMVPIGANIEPSDATEAIGARLRAGLDLRPRELLLVTFGLLNHSKGLPTLLAALARLNAESSVNRYRLALVGAGDAGLDPTDQATARELRQLIEQLGQRDRVIVTGALPAAEVAGWLRTADAVALPYVDGASYRRGSLLAAFACGAAVVTTIPAADHAGPAGAAAPLPALRSGDQALLVPSGDPAALAIALAAATSDTWLNRSLRRGAGETAAHFSWSAIAARTVAGYAAMLTPPPPS